MVQSSVSVSQVYLLSILICCTYKEALLGGKKSLQVLTSLIVSFPVIWHSFPFNEYKDFRNYVHFNSGSQQTNVGMIC